MFKLKNLDQNYSRKDLECFARKDRLSSLEYRISKNGETRKNI